MPICARKQKTGPRRIDQGFTTGSCNHRHSLSARAVHPPIFPCPTLSASAEPTSKRIVPTDNMRPKSDDAKRRHRLLKG